MDIHASQDVDPNAVSGPLTVSIPILSEDDICAGEGNSVDSC